jgi:hypothetical protein
MPSLRHNIAHHAPRDRNRSPHRANKIRPKLPPLNNITKIVRYKIALSCRGLSDRPELRPHSVCSVALWQNNMANGDRKAKKKLIATTPKLKIAAVISKQSTSQKLT